jgi:hypothetical protein
MPERDPVHTLEIGPEMIIARSVGCTLKKSSNKSLQNGLRWLNAVQRERNGEGAPSL